MEQAKYIGFTPPVENHHHYTVVMSEPETLPLAAFCELFHVTQRSVHSRVATGTWEEGKQYSYDPNGHIHVILEGYYAWTKSGKSKRKQSAKASESEMENAGSTSDGMESDTGKIQNLSQRRKAKQPRPVFDEKL